MPPEPFGFRLIDLQRQDIAFTTVWYRKGKALFGRGGAAQIEDVPWIRVTSFALHPSSR
jgi:hypothetical protein